MAIENVMIGDTVVAGADLSGAQFKAVTVTGVIAANANTAYGVLSGDSKPLSGEHARLNIAGIMKGVAAAAIAAGARITVTTSGFMTTITSGNGAQVGRNRNLAVASGSVFAFHGNFANANTNFDQQ